MRFPQQQYMLRMNDYQSCAGIMRHVDELGLFFKVLTEKCLMEKRKKTKDTVLINDSDDKNSIADDKQHVKMVMSFEDLNALVSGCYEMFS